jgi:putative nucleotidyltransferase with HDIG domain
VSQEAAAGGLTSAAMAAQMEKIVARRIEQDQLVVPPLAAVALKCLGLLKNPEFPFKEAAAIIEKDPVVTARLLRYVNSAATTAREPMKSVLNAVTRLGSQRLRTFLVEISAHRLFDSHDARITESCRGVWEHSLAVAGLARDVAVLANCGDPETAYMSGLLHDVGKPIVAGLLLEAERIILTSKPGVAWLAARDWVDVIQRVHRKVGVQVAERWELPQEVCRSIRGCGEYESDERLSTANAVCFANALAKREGLYVGDIVREDVDALVMIGRSLLGLDEEVCTRLTSNLKTTVKAQLH